MARITLHDRTYPAKSVVLHQFSRDAILGMDFLNQHSEIIDLRSKSITLSRDNAIQTERSPSRRGLSVLEDEVSVAPRSSIVISVGTETPAAVESIIKRNERLLLDREICVARGIARLHGPQTEVMLTNFSQEFKQINKGTTIAYIEAIV